MSDERREAGSSGKETRDALEAVLDDQVRRKELREEVGNKPPKPPRPYGVIAAVLLVLTVWIWYAPPGWVRPAPFPLPSSGQVEAGLRMDVFIAASQVLDYQTRNERLPGALSDALAEPEQADGLSYRIRGRTTFEIIGVREDQVVVYTSTSPLADLVGPAVRELRSDEGR